MSTIKRFLRADLAILSVLGASFVAGGVACSPESSEGEAGDGAALSTDAAQKTADFLCGLVNADPKLPPAQYDARFAPSVLTALPASERPALIESVMRTTFSRHGACRTAKLQSFASAGEKGSRKTYFLAMADQKRIAVSFSLASDNKIDWFDLGREEGVQGVIGPDSDYDVSLTDVKADDGVALKTVVFRRPDGNKRPVILLRTPYFYDHGHFQYEHYFATADLYLKEGYSFAVQAIRGTGQSGGEYLFMNPKEIADGAATVRWAASLPYSNGKVGIVGVSYDGFTALAAGVTNPPGLEVIMAGGSPVQAADGPFMRNGLVDQKQLDYLRYNYTQNGPVFLRTDDPKAFDELLLGVVAEPDLRKYDERLFGIAIPEWKTLSSHFADTRDPFWKTRQIFDRVHEIDVPTYHVSGMSEDGDALDVMNNFMEVSEKAAHPERHRLILGAWAHGGSIPYDDGSNAGAFIRERYLPLLAHHLKGESTSFTEEPRVQVATHQNLVVKSGVFPPPELVTHTVYFGAGRLTEQPVVGPVASSYDYHPLSPFDLSAMPADAHVEFDYRASSSMKLIGYIGFDLQLKIEGLGGDRVDQTDVVASVVKLAPGNPTPELVTSACLMGGKVPNTGEVVHLEVKNSCFVDTTLEAGSTLRVVVLSNVYPTLLRNPGGAGGHYYDRFHGAHVSVLHSPEHPSLMTFTTFED